MLFLALLMPQKISLEFIIPFPQKASNETLAFGWEESDLCSLSYTNYKEALGKHALFPQEGKFDINWGIKHSQSTTGHWPSKTAILPSMKQRTFHTVHNRDKRYTNSKKKL